MNPTKMKKLEIKQYAFQWDFPHETRVETYCLWSVPGTESKGISEGGLCLFNSPEGDPTNNLAERVPKILKPYVEKHSLDYLLGKSEQEFRTILSREYYKDDVDLLSVYLDVHIGSLADAYRTLDRIAVYAGETGLPPLADGDYQKIIFGHWYAWAAKLASEVARGGPLVEEYKESVFCRSLKEALSYRSELALLGINVPTKVRALAKVSKSEIAKKIRLPVV